MTECEEVAGAILKKMLQLPKTMNQARTIAKLYMPGETTQVIDNVAEALLRASTKA